MKKIKNLGIAALLLALLLSFSSCNLEDIIGGKGSLEESRKEEEKESEEAILADDDEPCKKCGLPNHPELVRT